MGEVFESLEKVVAGKDLDLIAKSKLLNGGLIARVSWSQYVITKNGSLFMDIFSKNLN